MEKQGMGRRRRFVRSGLLIGLRAAGLIIFLLFPGALLLSQSGDPGGEDVVEQASLAVAAVTAPARPVVRGSLTVTILADHPAASEVTVRPPRFPSTLILERVRTEARYIRQPAGPDAAGPPADPARWTAVEFLFTPLASGTVTLDPFEVTVGSKKAATGNISVSVYEESRSSPRNAPVFRWESPPSSLTTGESRELTLVLSNWGLQSLPGNFFRGKAPLNAVIEELPLDGPGEDGTIRYRFRVIPLGGSSLVLEPFSFQAEGITLNVPRLSAALTAAGNTGPSEAAEPVREEEAPREDPGPEGSRVVPFPVIQGDAPLFLRGYERIVKEAGTLWKAGNYAQALAYMRRNERDNLPGPALAPLRRDMERSLGLSLTEDEKWQPWKIPAFSWIILLLLLAAVIGVWKIKVTSGRFKGYKNVVILVAAGSVLILLLLCGGLWNSKSGTLAVLEKTAAYRVPDAEGAVNALFSEGQPVVIRAGRSQWIYAEAMDGRAGWVPAEAVISY